MKRWALSILLLLIGTAASGQVYSPKVLLAGQVDASSLETLVEGVYRQAGAETEREKVEAIWRYFLTDGRFVEPGFWYHIAGWAYEEPLGEVLDAMQLINSYGFGLCYHIAPLLEAVFEAGGFPDARVWFLTGHTVTEVFYEGAYHHFDSDMLGYSCVEGKTVKDCHVASVREIEKNGEIITGKLLAPDQVNAKLVDEPWYPADVRAKAIGGLAGLFTSTSDNWLFPYTRYARSHTMDFVLRRGERLIRYFEPEEEGLFYLPYANTENGWREFPREFARWKIRTEDGPHSQKDNRRWATGRLEYRPLLGDRSSYYFPLNQNLRLPSGGGGILVRRDAERPGYAVFEVASPYVVIDAAFKVTAALAGPEETMLAETSTDGGYTWLEAGTIEGPFEGEWKVAPRVMTESEHGARNAVGGSYSYLVRFTMAGPGAAAISDVALTTRVQLNPRTLPKLASGENRLQYEPGPAQRRWSAPVRLDRVHNAAALVKHIRYFEEDRQGFLLAADNRRAEILFELSAPDGGPLASFDAGARFLDIRDGIAPDKLKAEIRKTSIQSTCTAGEPAAAIEWSTSADGEFKSLWEYDPNPEWRDGTPIDRLLRWPEVDRRVSELPAGTRKVYVRYRLEGIALDDIRLSVTTTEEGHQGELEIVHVWDESGERRTHAETVAEAGAAHDYVVEAQGPVVNRAVILQVR